MDARSTWGFLALVALAPSLAGAAEAAPKREKVAITELKALGSVDPKEIEGLTGIVAVSVSELKRFEVITKSDIQAMLGYEREKELLGCSEVSCLAEIGGAMGVDYLVASEASKIGGRWVVSMSLVAVKKSRSVARVSKEVPDSELLVFATRSATRELFAELVPIEAPAAAVASTAPREEPSRTASWLRYGGAAAGLVGGGVLYASGWATYQEFESPSGGVQTVTREDASSATLRSGVGLGLAAAGAGLLVWELLD